jgi:hypothetical protein
MAASAPCFRNRLPRVAFRLVSGRAPGERRSGLLHDNRLQSVRRRQAGGVSRLWAAWANPGR